MLTNSKTQCINHVVKWYHMVKSVKLTYSPHLLIENYYYNYKSRHDQKQPQGGSREKLMCVGGSGWGKNMVPTEREKGTDR